MMLEINDLLLEVVINLAAYATVRPSGGHQGIKTGFPVRKVPFFQSSRRIVPEGSVRRLDSLCRNGTKVSTQGFIVFLVPVMSGAIAE